VACRLNRSAINGGALRLQCRSSDFVSVTLDAFQLCRRFGGLLGELVFAPFPAWDFDGARRLDHRQQHTEHDKDDWSVCVGLAFNANSLSLFFGLSFASSVLN
jgi:hypothetical protein